MAEETIPACIECDTAAHAVHERTEDRQVIESLIELNNQRMATYGLISRMYRVEIDKPTLEKMRTMLFPAATGNEKVDEGFKLLATYLSRSWGNSITELAADYVRVFIGDTNELDGAAFPYESVYTSEKHLAMQEARDEVLAIYCAYGMKKDESWKEAEDHVAVELEFMKAMCQHIDDELKNGTIEKAAELFASQSNFLEDHLVSWVPMLTADVRHFAQTDFYQGLAYLTDGYLETDKEFLQDFLADVK